MFVSRLKSKMQNQRLSQTELSTRMGISQNAVYKWLNGGTITMDNAIKLADVLGVEPAWLLFGVNDKQKKVDMKKIIEDLNKLDKNKQLIIQEIITAFG